MPRRQTERVVVELETTWSQVLAWRMRRQLLDPIEPVEAPDVVRRLCGVQAQVPAAAALAIGVRQAEPVPGAVERELNDGRLMRTWAVRGTLHLLTRRTQVPTWRWWARDGAGSGGAGCVPSASPRMRWSG